LPRDGAAHRLRAEAVGFGSRTESVMLDTMTVRVEMVLPREERSVTPAAR
jgi:hypothetical protein